MYEGTNWTKVAAIAGGVSAAAAALTAIAHSLLWVTKKSSADNSTKAIADNLPVTVGALKKVLEKTDILHYPEAIQPYLSRPILIYGQLGNISHVSWGGGYFRVRSYDLSTLITVHFEEKFGPVLAKFEVGSTIELLVDIIPSDLPISMTPEVMNFHNPRLRDQH
jgi:hypothetical protein